MCFRPGVIEIDKKCAECGTYCDSKLEVCTKCGAPLPENKVVAAAGGAPASAPKAPGSPGAPKMPPGIHRPPASPKK